MPAPDRRNDAADAAMAEPGSQPAAAAGICQAEQPVHRAGLIETGRVASMVILSLSLEVTAGVRQIRSMPIEPKLRDGFLQVLFDHANSGRASGAHSPMGPTWSMLRQRRC
ncbi:MAG: hypothetical protein U5N10_01240 [Gemmobacter sp.]|nr:hypothetical protein [Gemmobacter sp.]